MKILVTGATGFIGFSLVKRLAEEKHDVHQLVRYRAGRWDGYNPKNLNFADLRDFENVKRVLLAVRPEVVIHLAAVSAVSFSFQNPKEVMDVNNQGTINMALASMEAGVQHFIYASSSEVYGKATVFPTPEDSPLGATSPYAQSKINAENYLRFMWDLYKFPVTIMRPFNSYGRANVDNRHFVVERAIVGALQDKVINLHDPRPWRDFMFREDHVNAYVACVEKRPIGETVNICTGNCWTIKQMADEVAKQIGDVKVEFAQTPDRPLDIMTLHGDNSKAQRVLGWKPKYGLSLGITIAINEWMNRLNSLEYKND